MAAPPTEHAASGLTESEAATRLRERGPLPKPATSRSYRSIVVANTFTVFNLILVVFGAATIAFGSPKDALFLGVVVANTAIGIFQEVRAKRALDKLAALIAPTATVIRDGAPRSVAAADVVVGDLVRIAAGDQVVVDGTVVSADGLAVDESNLTGESEPVGHGPGEAVFSGSFVVEGQASVEATAVGPDSHAAQITETARAFRHPRSPLERAMDRLLLILVAFAVPLFIGQALSLGLRGVSTDDAVTTLTAAVVNLVPEGLILLASLTAAVSAAKLARRGVLAQQLNAIESLASVDVLCTDKTGTLTEPTLRVVGLIPHDGVSEDALGLAFGRYAASSESRNTTLQAIFEAGLGAPAAAAGDTPDPPASGVAAPAVAARDAPAPAVAAEPVSAQVPFSSRRRWSALELGGDRLVLGAPEALVAAGPLRERATAEASSGRRVLAIGTTATALPEAAVDAPLPDDLQPLGIVVLAERLRADADRTVAFFAEEDVALKVLSGDAPATVGAIARDAGIPGDAPALDGGALPEDDDELRAALAGVPAIGRISPDGKARVIQSLVDGGAYVGMVGDGVNDVPALKTARLAIAQGSGTQMARSVADLVLVSGEFSEVPRMVSEGRQILRNIQRVARLFITKTVLAGFLVLALGITTGVYPLLPRQFTLSSSLTIGIPAFFLALAPSSGPWRPERFLQEVARFAIPAGIGIGIGVLAGYVVARVGFGLTLDQARTVSTMVVVSGGLGAVVAIENEPGKRRLVVLGLCGLMGVGYVLVWTLGFGRGFFELSPVTADLVWAWAIGAVLASGLMVLGLAISRRWAP